LNSKDRHVQNVRVPSLNQGPQKFRARDAPFSFHKEVFYTFTYNTHHMTTNIGKITST